MGFRGLSEIFLPRVRSRAGGAGSLELTGRCTVRILELFL